MKQEPKNDEGEEEGKEGKGLFYFRHFSRGRCISTASSYSIFLEHGSAAKTTQIQSETWVRDHASYCG